MVEEQLFKLISDTTQLREYITKCENLSKMHCRNRERQLILKSLATRLKFNTPVNPIPNPSYQILSKRVNMLSSDHLSHIASALEFTLLLQYKSPSPKALHME